MLKSFLLDNNGLTDRFMKNFCKSLKSILEEDFKSNFSEDEYYRNSESMIQSDNDMSVNNSRSLQPALSSLGFANNNFTDYAIVSLEDLLTSGSYYIRNLAHLDISQNKLTDHGRNKLRDVEKQRSKLQIVA